MKNGNDKSLESWIWDAACSIRGAGEEYRPLAEIAQELRDLEDEAMATSKHLDKLFSTLGV